MSISDMPKEFQDTTTKSSSVPNQVFPGSTQQNDAPNTADDKSVLPRVLWPDNSDSAYSIDALTARERHLGEVVPIEEFFKMACTEPDIYLRNPALYFADAIRDYGYTSIKNYGVERQHYHCLDLPWEPASVKQRKIPRDRDDIMQQIVSKMLKAGNQIRSEKGFLFRGMPGSGKDVLIMCLFSTLEDYSRRHPRGMQYRLAFRFDNEDEIRSRFGFHQEKKSGTGARGYLISSPTNCNPAFILSNRAFKNEPASDRENFVSHCKGDFNRDYVLASQIDPMSAKIFDRLIEYYDGDVKTAMREHVVAERWFHDLQSGEGVYAQFPHSDPGSTAYQFFRTSPFTGRYIPEQLEDFAHEIPDIQSNLCRANYIYLEDMFADNVGDRSEGDLSRLGYLLAYVERGDLQFRSGDFTLTVKDKNSLVFASINDEQVKAKQQGKTFDPLNKRFYVITVPCIRQFREEAEVHRTSLEESFEHTHICPHVLEILSLFITSTRLFNPQPGNYENLHDKSDESVGQVAKKLRAVRKALFFQSPDFTERHEDLNINPKWPRLSADEIRILRENEDAVREEFSSDIDKIEFSYYDGGFGIATRDAEKLIEKFTGQFRGAEYVTVIDILAVLRKKLEAGYEYFSAFEKGKNEYLQKLFRQACESAGQDKDAIGAYLSGNINNSKLAAIYQRVKKEVDGMLPVSTPEEIFSDVESYARQKVRDDFRQFLCADDLQERVIKYIWHLLAFRSNHKIQVPEKYRTVKKEFADRNDPLGQIGVDLEFMSKLEQEVFKNLPDKHAEEFRDKTFNSIIKWKSNQAEGVTLAEVIYDIFSIDHINQILSALQENSRESNIKKIIQFYELTQKYLESPHLLDLDLLVETSCNAAHEWIKIKDSLVSSGYHEQCLAKHINWAFSEEIRGR